MDSIRLILDILILGVWLLYAHLFYKSWKSSRTPRLLIGVSSDSEGEDVVYLTNLSEKNIHIDQIEVYDSESSSSNITHLKNELENREKSDSILENSYQGPIPSGGIREIRGFTEFLSRFNKNKGEIKLRVLSIYSEEFRHIGFQRELNFETNSENKLRLKAQNPTYTIKAKFNSGVWEVGH